MYDSITNLGLSFGDGTENPSGVAELAFLVPLSWAKAGTGIKKPVAGGTTAESLVTIATAHEMAVGKAPIQVTPLFSKSGASWKLAGEELSKIFEQGAELFIPNNSVKSLGTAQALKNYRYILLIGKVDGSGHFWQIGSELISAKIVDMAGGTGVGPTGEVGTKVTVQSHSPAPIYTYTAAVPVTGA